MYKVLLADDEQIVLEGLTQCIAWKKLDLHLVGTAMDGLAASALIEEHLPDIVITDIRMPGRSGLELIERYSTQMPSIRFVILSGYDEFDFASRAMSHGIKHYLLKPCDEQEVEKVLQEVTDELQREEQAALFLEETQKQLVKVLPHAKEMFFREATLAQFYTVDKIKSYQQLFGIEGESFRLMVLQPDNPTDYVEKFSLKKITEEILEPGTIIISTIMQDQVCLLVKEQPMEEQIEEIQRIKHNYARYFDSTFSATVTDAGPLEELRRLYQQAETCLSHRFYLGENALILPSDLPKLAGGVLLGFEMKELQTAVQNGDSRTAEEQLSLFFRTMERKELPDKIIEGKSMELFIEVLSQNDMERMSDSIDQFLQAKNKKGVRVLEQFLRNEILRLAENNLEQVQQQHNHLVEQVIRCIEENIAHPDLSLHWIATQILYMNSDYLGRLFLKETGERFSQYLLTKRMELAKELIEDSSKDMKIYEIARAVGFPKNPQYFSQIFKKYTGVSPKDYEKQISQRIKE